MHKFCILVLLIYCCLFVPCTAQTPLCDQMVIDDAAEFGTGIREVEKAAQELRNIGAEPRIRTIKNMGNTGTLDKYFDNVRSGCPSWQGINGGWKNNLIIIAHSRQDKQSLILGGEQWKSPLNSNFNRIISDHMRPRFRQDDYAGGFVAGITETQDVLYNHLHPGGKKTVIHMSNFGKYALGIAVILVLGIGGWFAYRHVTMANLAANELKEARRNAIASKARARSRIADSEDFMLHLTGAFTSDAEQAKKLYKAASDEYAQHGADKSAFRPEDKGLTLNQYRSIQEIYDGINLLLDEGDAYRLKALG